MDAALHTASLTPTPLFFARTPQQGRLQELEARIAQASGELELARGARAALEQRLIGAKTRAEADELVRRLDEAEQVATRKFNDNANIAYRAEVRAAGPRCAAPCAHAAGVTHQTDPCRWPIHDVATLRSAQAWHRARQGIVACPS